MHVHWHGVTSSGNRPSQQLGSAPGLLPAHCWVTASAAQTNNIALSVPSRRSLSMQPRQKLPAQARTGARGFSREAGCMEEETGSERMQPLGEMSWELNVGVFEPSVRFLSTVHTP